MGKKNRYKKVASERLPNFAASNAERNKSKSRPHFGDRLKINPLGLEASTKLGGKPWVRLVNARSQL
jgi:hypothetical protein